MKVINIQKEKLGYDFLNGYEEYKNVIIRSDTGTGKSTTIKHYLKENNLKFISITSRKSLAVEHFRIFSEHGLECQLYTDMLKQNKSSIFQLESLHKLFNFITSKQIEDYVLVIDEVNSLIQHLITSPTITHRESRMEVMASLQLLIQKCKKVIVVDATISESVFKFLGFWEAKTCYIDNSYKNNKNVNASELSSYEEMTTKLKKLKKYMVCCDSANNAKALYQELNDKNIKLITAEINETKTETLNLDDYDKIIFSPKIIYGLDSTLRRPVFCYYSTRTIDAVQMYQQLSRTRNIKKLYFFFVEKPTYKRLYKNLKDIEEEQQQLNGWMEERYELIGRCKIYKLIQDLKNIQKFKSDELRENCFKSFVKVLISKGFVVKLAKIKTKTTKKSKKDILEQFHQENFNFEKNIINKMMKLPEEVASKNIELLSSGYEYMKHINLILWNESTDDELSFELCSKAYRSFPDDLIKSKLYKMNLLRKLLTTIDTDFNSIIVKNTRLEPDEIQSINFQIKKMYPRNKTVVNKAYDIVKIIKHIINDIFPANLFNSIRYTYDNSKKLQTQRLVIEKELFDHHMNLYEYRKKEEIDFIEDDDEPDI